MLSHWVVWCQGWLIGITLLWVSKPFFSGTRIKRKSCHCSYYTIQSTWACSLRCRSFNKSLCHLSTPLCTGICLYTFLFQGHVALRHFTPTGSSFLACSKRSDSGERCEVKKAIKSRGDWGESWLLPLPRFYFFRAPFYFAPLPTIWTPGKGYVILWMYEARFCFVLHHGKTFHTTHFPAKSLNFPRNVAMARRIRRSYWITDST